MLEPEDSVESVDERALVAGLALIGLFALSVIAIALIFLS